MKEMNKEFNDIWNRLPFFSKLFMGYNLTYAIFQRGFALGLEKAIFKKIKR